MRIELDWTGNIGFKAKTRQFDGILMDEPAEFHGNDTGPSSVEYLGIGIGGCLGTSFSYCLKRMEIQIESMHILLDVNMHHVDEGGYEPLRITDIAVDIQVKLKEDQDPDVFDLCIESFKKYCVVTQSVIRGISVEVNVKKE